MTNAVPSDKFSKTDVSTKTKLLNLETIDQTKEILINCTSLFVNIS